MSCPHFETVFKNTQVKSTFLNKYRMVKNLLLQSVDLNNNCDFMAHQCNDCTTIHDGGNTFLCLQCTYIGCWNHHHFEQHLKQTKHTFGVNANTGELFCFKCEKYVMDYAILNNIDHWSNWDLIDATTSPLPQKFHTINGLTGIHNMGSTCFMSSVVQSLIHNPYYQRWIFDQNHLTTCDLQNELSCLSCAFQDMMNISHSQNYDSDKTFVKLLQCCFKTNSNFTGSTQQDAHEFWQFLLNQIHSDFVRSSPIPQSTGSTNQIGQNSALSNNAHLNSPASKKGNQQDPYTKHLCPCVSHTTFQGFLKSTITCPSCSEDSSTVDPFMDLSLELSNNIKKNTQKTLYDCLDTFHRTEILQDYNFNCSHCSKKNIKSVSKKFVITKLPPVLAFQLKRFKHNMNGVSEKLNQFVEFPKYLNMKNYVEFPNPNESVDIVFELFAVITHEGTVDTGHYVSYCKLSNQSWVRFNDSDVQQVSEQKVLQEKAYLLFYIVKSR